MPSSFPFLVHSQSSGRSSSSSSLSNDSKSDQSDNDEIHFDKKRTIQTDNDMLERPSDHDDDDDDEDSYSQTDGSDNDLFTSSNNPPEYVLSRQFTFYENDWLKEPSLDQTKFKQSSIHREERSLFPSNDTPLIESSQRRLFAPERSQSVSIGDNKHPSRNIPPALPSDLTTSVQELHLNSVPDQMQTRSARTRTNIDIDPLPVKQETTRMAVSKIPIRKNLSSQSRSRSPAVKHTTTNRKIPSPTMPSKIPVPVSSTSKGAFRIFTAEDRPTGQLPPPPVPESTQPSNQTTQKVSPFTPITHSKAIPSFKKSTSSAGNTPSAKARRAQLPISDDEEVDDDEEEAKNLKEEDLRLKLQEEKRYGKQTGELLNQLHENYEELLEKYAQAENTIDQLRFQPKIFGENTPTSTVSEGMIHFIQQPKVNIASLRSNGVHHTLSNTPVSSIRQVVSTTSTTSALKSTSPGNSCTGESVFFDEAIPQQIVVQELTTPETIKLDLLIQTKTLSEKMKAFLTLMDANQLSLAEQQQVYESIKEDYEKLLKTLDRTKRGSDLSDIDLDGDLNDELEMMKQLLKEIVKRITENLLGKSSNSSETGRQSRLTRDGSHSSQLSVRSSLCNHAELMDQYQKLLNAVNTGNIEKNTEVKPTSHESSQSDTPIRRPPTNKSQKASVYTSVNSDDEHQRSQTVTPISTMKRVESTPFDLDYIPSRSSKHHQQVNEEKTHVHGIAKTISTKQKRTTNQRQDYDNLDNLTKTKHKGTKHSNRYQAERELSPSIPPSGTRHSGSSIRTRTNDYDSGIGTNNTTKLSRDSRLNTSTIDESHYQSLDEEKRRCSDEEQESMSSVSSSRSSGSGAASPENFHSKYTKRFDNFSPLKQQRYERARRKPSGHSDTYQSDIETHLTGSFDPLPPATYQYKSRRSHHSLQLRRSCLTPSCRSLSTDTLQYSTRPQTAPPISSRTIRYHRMGRKYQSGLLYRSSDHAEPTYKSSFYIDQAHTNGRGDNSSNQRIRQTSNNLYLDSQTGIIYRYIPNKTQPSPVTFYQPISQVKTAKELYECGQCGSITTYHHRHHLPSHIRRKTKDIDDPGYESGNRRRRIIEHVTSSDSEPDDNPTYLNMSLLNEAYERAKKAQHRSRNLSRNISRHLRLVLNTM